MKKLIVGNWKEHFSPGAASTYYQKLAKMVHAGQAEVVLCPPMLDVYPVSRELDDKKFKLGAQNLYFEDNGAFTGETSAAMLKGLVDYAIIGHSERRQVFGEDNLLVAKKVAAALRNRIQPILCVGETLLERSEELTSRVVVDQLTVGLHFVSKEDLDQVVVAYEPIWAIGTGNFARPDDVIPVARLIHQTITELFGESAAQIRLLYGGSVDGDNAAAFLSLGEVDGLLVGGASVNASKFARIVEAAQH
ncbi:MAG TPA: triose-phosphate isomerase [Candidatus Saccharimonadales bacterium]|nr:triose-phosphate isomerase [Candidatus Saccharimonadales bacterium]